METYDRYSLFRQNGTIGMVPNITLNKKSTDYYEIYKQGFTRLDVLSYKYYKNPNYDWLILMANPEVGSLEYSIEDNTELRIPYPLDITLQEYNSKVENYNRLNK